MHHFEKHFLQSPLWYNSWTSFAGLNHTIKIFETDNLTCVVYKYPWHGSFLYHTGKGPIFKNTANGKKAELTNFISLIKQIVAKAKKENVAYINIDFSDEISTLFGIENKLELYNILKVNDIDGLDLNSSSILYPSSANIDLSPLSQTDKNTEKTIEQFFLEAKPLINTFGSQAKRKIKKGLKCLQEGLITYSAEKTEKTFNDFHSLYLETSAKQGFNPIDKQYLKNLFSYDFCKILIIYDTNGLPANVWFGLQIDNTITNLLAGNSDFSRLHCLQDLAHLITLKLAVEEGLNMYDLGGYNPDFGFSTYKENYNPIIRNFVGPLNIVVDKPLYNKIKFLKKAKNIIKNVKNVIKQIVN